MIFTRLAQAVIIAIPILLIGYLLNQELVPSGEFHVRHAVNESSPFIDGLLPDQRVGPIKKDLAGDWVQPVIDDPVFFFVHPHRGFDTIEAEVWFKNLGAPIVEFGGLASADAEAYDLLPLQNTLIDDSDWFRLEQNGITLLERDKMYMSIGDFLANPPGRSEIATYHYSLARPFVLEGYAPVSGVQTVDVSLRGFHEFKTYIKNEALSFDFAYMDMNRDEGADPVAVLVTKDDGTAVGEAHASDDGNLSDDAIPSEMRHVSVFIPGLAEGVYKIELRVDRDIFFRTIKTPQQKITFLNNVYLGDEIAWHEPARSVPFWTEAKHMSFTTQHADSVQIIHVGGDKANVSEPYAKTTLEIEQDGIVSGVAPKGDLQIVTDGHIAFSASQYFNPDPVRLSYNTDLDRLGVNYVIARYVAPEQVGDWSVAQVVFDAHKLLLQDKTWKFVFSTPGIKELGAELDVGRIDMTWKRPPL